MVKPIIIAISGALFLGCSRPAPKPSLSREDQTVIRSAIYDLRKEFISQSGDDLALGRLIDATEKLRKESAIRKDRMTEAQRRELQNLDTYLMSWRKQGEKEALDTPQLEAIVVVNSMRSQAMRALDRAAEAF